MAIAFDSQNSDSVGSAASLIISHTLGSGTDMVAYAAGFAADQAMSTTYNGTSMTELYDGTPGASSGFRHLGVWRLSNNEGLPAAGTYNVELTPASSARIAMCCVSYSGVDQTTPNDAIDIQGGVGTAVSNTVSGASGDMVIDFVSSGTGDAATPGTGQTERVDEFNGDEFIDIRSSEEASAASVDMSWTIALSVGWTSGGLNLNVSSGGGGAAFPAGMLNNPVAFGV